MAQAIKGFKQKFCFDLKTGLAARLLHGSGMERREWLVKRTREMRLLTYRVSDCGQCFGSFVYDVAPN